jgi:hypothetical protein
MECEHNLDNKTLEHLKTHKLIMKSKYTAVLPLDQLFYFHLLRMHKHYNALHYHSHTSLRNW